MTAETRFLPLDYFGLPGKHSGRKQNFINMRKEVPRTNFAMYYVYVLSSVETKELYIGYTNNLEKRLGEHNTNRNKSTKNKGKWILIYSEMYKSKEDAKVREYRLKHYGQALNEPKKRIKGSLQLANLVRGR